MKYLIAVAPFAALMMFAQTGPSSDEAAVREVVQKYVNARELRDPKAIEALFTEDADQLVSDGVWRKGRDAIVKGTLASSQQSSGQRTIEVESVRFLSADVAIADGRYTLAGTNGAPARQMWTSILLKRQNGWRIAGIRNMLPAPQQTRP
jgi:uncharacterized protein (TIGR02246 family)